MKKYFAPFLFSFLLGAIFSLSAKEACHADSKKEIATLVKQLEATRTDLGNLRKDFETFKSQKSNAPCDCSRKTGELERILAKFGNNPEGMSALHYAIKVGDVAAVSILLANGADVNSKDADFTALARAARYNQFEIAQILLNLGADVNLTLDKYSSRVKSAICYAAEYGTGDLVSLFIDNGACIDKVNPLLINNAPQGTPLLLACAAGNYEAVVTLVKAGSNLDGALDSAVSKLKYKDDSQNLELVKFLVEHDAKRNGRSYENLPCPVIGGYLKSVAR